MNPHTITTFTGDSLTIRVAVYDDQNQPFILHDNEIDSAFLYIEPLGLEYRQVEIKENVVIFFVPAGEVEKPGIHPFYIRIYGNARQFTIARGSINILDPNIPDI